MVLKMNQDLFNIMANCLQVYNTVLLEKDASNNDVMKALQEQNNIYFERIIKQLDELTNELRELRKNIKIS